VLAAEVLSYNPETPNTFDRNLLRRLGILHDHMEAEATSPDNTKVIHKSIKAMEFPEH